MLLILCPPIGLSYWFFLVLSLAMARSLNFFVFGESRPPCASYYLTAERLSISFRFWPPELSLTGIYSSFIINFFSTILEGEEFGLLLM